MLEVRTLVESSNLLMLQAGHTRDARETTDQATSKRIFWRSISSEICLFLSKRPRESFFVPSRRLFHASYEVLRELHMKFPFKQLLRTTSYEIEKFEEILQK